MRNAAFALVFAAGLVLVAAGGWWNKSAVFAQPPAGERPAGERIERFPPSEGLIALTLDATEGRQMVVLVDPKARVMSVYDVDRTSGEISLKSVRNVQWDLLMEEFNGVSPSPRQIRSLLEQR